jgi:hypothetical protein
MMIQVFARLQLTPYDYGKSLILRKSMPCTHKILPFFILFLLFLHACFLGIEMQELQNNHIAYQ